VTATDFENIRPRHALIREFEGAGSTMHSCGNGRGCRELSLILVAAREKGGKALEKC
jgi:hypothetical protein